MEIKCGGIWIYYTTYWHFGVGRQVIGGGANRTAEVDESTSRMLEQMPEPEVIRFIDLVLKEK